MQKWQAGNVDPVLGAPSGATGAGEGKAVIRRQLLPAGHAGVARSFEAQRGKTCWAEQRDGRPDLPDATLRPRAQAGEQAGKWVTWNHFSFLPAVF